MKHRPMNSKNQILDLHYNQCMPGCQHSQLIHRKNNLQIHYLKMQTSYANKTMNKHIYQFAS